MMITVEDLEQEIERRIKERDDFLAEANRHIATLNGGIHALEQMLELASEPVPANGQAEPAID